MPTTTAANVSANSGARTLHHWVAGAHHKGSGDRFSSVANPETGEVAARLALVSAADVDAAVTVAEAAFPRWRDRSLGRRTEVVFRLREPLDARAAELADPITTAASSTAQVEVEVEGSVIELATTPGLYRRLQLVRRVPGLAVRRRPQHPQNVGRPSQPKS
ncbi:aldehyde dehydrogenase family protein [Modestobacter marinus]|uniref:aldehyde dehydrogenase family protein n=1 Tax=Modestobacter marinus TaxID=477641 RepID=UPI001C940154|nr:aldehyde dehydrogenase family protein [Modestobacter marinus]